MFSNSNYAIVAESDLQLLAMSFSNSSTKKICNTCQCWGSHV